MVGKAKVEGEERMKKKEERKEERGKEEG